MAGHRWARIDLTYLTNPKLRGLPPEVVLLHLASILHCAEHLTDGQIAYRSLTDLAQIAYIDKKWARRRASLLVDRGLWIETETGWQLHDFEAMNPQAMRCVVERDRALARERQHRHRNRDVTP